MVLVVYTHEEMPSSPNLGDQRAWTAAAMVGDYYEQRRTTWCWWKEDIQFWFHYYLPRKFSGKGSGHKGNITNGLAFYWRDNQK
jgi:hypothetical protein